MQTMMEKYIRIINEKKKITNILGLSKAIEVPMSNLHRLFNPTGEDHRRNVNVSVIIKLEKFGFFNEE